jgi:hypothetical protein
VPTYAKTTSVPVDRSKAEIERTLSRFGASSFMYGWDGEARGAGIQFKMNDRLIRFTIPMPDREEFRVTDKGRKRPGGESAVDNAWEQAIRQRWRALALVIKAKLEAVESQIVAFEQEFMPFVVMPGGKTVYEMAKGEVALAYEKGSPPAMLLGLASKK